MKKLLIVESPAKAKTIGKYLGGEFVVKSSVGHIRDLPKESGAIRIVEDGPDRWKFVPTYVISEGKDKVVSELKGALKDVSEVYLASDPDREGEAIAWHLKEVLGPGAGARPFRRVTYNEITKSAVLKAVAEPREIDMPLVDAQQARRILDRIVGYKVSPLLWKNISCANNRSLSAGRVQSVALRLLVERQREIDNFKPETYYLMGVEARKPSDAKSFVAKLARLDGKKPDIRDRETANGILMDLAEARLSVAEVKSQPKVRHALPPFTTSTLQQAASSVLGFSPGKTMKLAQSLYEHGRITYMRTDSVNVSDQARQAAKDFVVANYGGAFYPAKPNFFRSKADAQGAHEAIRPSDVNLTPVAAKDLEAAELKLYDLIWRRFLASQMAEAKTTVKTIVISAAKPGICHRYAFTASATAIDFEGFLRVMKLSAKRKRADAEDDEESDEVAYLPDVASGDALEAVRWLSDEKQTKGPTHYSEASLIKALEENGVGRPSTYAATIETLKAREYAKTEKRNLVPLERGVLVCDWLVKKLDSLFSVGYTAQMEEALDKVAEHGEPMDGMLSAFYAKFLKDIGGCAEPPPDAAKFALVFELLAQVRDWKPAKKVGRRVYDDRAFVDSIKEQAAAGRSLSARQLEFLVKMAVQYADQIPDCENRLKEGGLGAGATVSNKADPAIVRFCFDTLKRVDGIDSNPFMKSLFEQCERGRSLSLKQLAVLAKAAGESAADLPDCGEIREKIGAFVVGGFDEGTCDPVVAPLISLFDGLPDGDWRPSAKRGKKVYDDREFVRSLADQFRRRHMLSPRQVMALWRVVNAYRKRLPRFEERFAALGLTEKADGESRA